MRPKMPTVLTSNGLPLDIIRSAAQGGCSHQQRARRPQRPSRHRSASRDERAGASGSPDGGGMRWTTASGSPRCRYPPWHWRGPHWSIEDEGLLDLITSRAQVGRREVNLVDDRDHLQVIIERQIHVGEVCAPPLSGVTTSRGALARGEQARDLVGKSTCPGCRQVEYLLAVVGTIGEGGPRSS